MAVWDFLSGLVAVLVEALLKVFAQQLLTKVIAGVGVYALLFVVIPLLIKFLVPSNILQSVGQLSGAISGAGVVGNVDIGAGILYGLGFVQFPALVACVVSALAVRFLFRRI
jgi:hypothetical protein